MALVSPGIQISINDQSQYVNSNVGSVPLVVLATAQDKTYNNALAAGTTKSNAGKLLSFTSQRDLLSAMGTPTFQLSSAGTPLHGSELNEYGLLTAYSALGVSNRLYAIRADIDLNALVGTSVRPIGPVQNDTVWLDLANTEFGLYALNSATSSFTHISPMLITDPTQVMLDTDYAYPVSTPKASVGQSGSYALVFVNPDESTVPVIRLFYKSTSLAVPSLTNSWVQVGVGNWQNTVPALQGSVGSSGSIITVNSTLFINGVEVTTTGTTISSLVSDINSTPGLDGITAVVSSSGRLTFFITSEAGGGGNMTLIDGTHTPLAICGIRTVKGEPIPTTSPGATFYCPTLHYGNYASLPLGGWFNTDVAPKPTGSIWWKTSSTGTGYSPVIKTYNSSLGEWVPELVPAYPFLGDAIYGLDPTGGGEHINHNQIIALYNISDTTANNLRFSHQAEGTGVSTTGTGALVQSDGVTPISFTAGDSFTIQSSSPGTAQQTTTTITLSSPASAQSFVSDILAADIPYINAVVNGTGSISLIHTTGGQIGLTEVSGTPLQDAGFNVNATSPYVIVNLATGFISISNFTPITPNIVYRTTTPYSAPEDGSLWYYANQDVDIMVNVGGSTGWRGYQNVTADIRGYNLSNTDINGVIVSGSMPTSQSTGDNLVGGDLWLDSSDLENYPKLYRYTGTTWQAIDNTDHISTNGIVFADARWDTNGETDIISGAFPSTTNLLVSNYLDADAPDFRLYPKGTLLFNTRRSGFNVKRFVKDYFNSTSFPNSVLPQIKDAWVTASGLDSSGVMKAGKAAQRSMVVAAMQSAVDSNTDIIEDNYAFNLLVAPGYPELIDNLVMLNDNRANTGFVIGDTPMTMTTSVTDITAWNNNTTGTGLATASPYLAVYYPAGLTNDLAGNTVAVPASHAVLRTYLYSDNVSYPWFAPAGVHRGLVSNLNDIGYVNSATGGWVHNGVNQGLRDALYSIKINPIAQLPGTGLVVWGQETKSGDSTARNRVNVVRLENYLRTIFKSIANGFLFEPNDTITRKSISRQIESACNDLLSKRGLYDFLVICDSNNNTSSTIANNQLYVDVAIEPMRDVEFIYIPIALYNPGTVAKLGASST
ncbi:Phage tail sheath C-terminal domain containing protein [uncultured Caudovirales phage]|uniref:Phage tail sheath C-terminal domain containing protein n=1 Tax=uncultured Caudovirales phage TaxID=2100421 RepID=A0A6J5L8K1_9CAUD|nr:Phage tail sheath C-terminal domain containing protein [uncultured Caudovirales phage]